MLDWRLKAYPPLADDGRAALVAEPALPADRLSERRLLLGPEAEEAAHEPGRGRSGAAPHLREARHLAGRAETAVRRRGRRGLRQRLGRDHLQGEAGRAGHHLLLVLRGGAAPSRAGAASTSARSCRTTTTFSPRSTRRSSAMARSVYIPKGVRCPMELSTYFRINAARHRPVRADADRGRGGRLCQLSGRLHRADARREPAARRGRRAGVLWARTRRSSTRPCRTGIPATRTARAASTTS